MNRLAFFPHVPVLAMNEQRAAKLGGACLDHFKCFVRLRSNDTRHTTFQYACLLARDGGERVAQELSVID